MSTEVQWRYGVCVEGELGSSEFFTGFAPAAARAEELTTERSARRGLSTVDLTSRLPDAATAFHRTRTLTAAGFAVTEARTMAERAAAFARTKFHIVLSDIQLPVGERLRALSHTAPGGPGHSGGFNSCWCLEPDGGTESQKSLFRREWRT